MSNYWPHRYPNGPPGVNGEGHGDTPTAGLNRTPAEGAHRTYDSPASSTVDDAKRLLGVYPFASATPTSHVARHLSDLTITAQTPAYMQQSTNSKYADGIAPLISNDPRYAEIWRREGNRTLRLLDEQERVRPHTHTIPPQPAPDWYNASPLNHSTHTLPPFAQTLLNQQYQQYHLPLASHSSSSLAHALDLNSAGSSEAQVDPRPVTNSPPTKENSRRFFDEFLEKTAAEIEDAKSGGRPPLSHSSTNTSTFISPKKANSSQMNLGQSSFPNTPNLLPSSPDPLLPSPLTPLKRKSTVMLESPTLKRSQSSSLSSLTPLQTSSHTPDSAATSSTLKSSKSPDFSPITPHRSASKLVAFVEIPKRKPFSTPTHLKNSTPSSLDDNLGGYGSASPSKSTGVRQSTGLRDERQPLEKLTSLLEDIFEAEDSVDPSTFDDNAMTDTPSSEFFSNVTSSSSDIHLSPEIINKISKAVRKVSLSNTQRRKKLFMNNKSPNSREGLRGGTSEIDVGVVSRILKCLERSVKMGEDIDLQSILSQRASDPMTSKADSPSKSSVTLDDSSTDIEQLSPHEVAKIRRSVLTMKEAILAADCCIALLASDHLAKQLYSEELITSCMVCVKTSLNSLIYPLMEALSSSLSPPYSRSLLLVCAESSQVTLRHDIQSIFNSLTSLIPSLNTLISTAQHTMSDGIIIQLVYIAIGPFFVPEAGSSDDLGKREKKVKKTSGVSTVESIFDRGSPMKGLRLDALALLRTIFAYHPDQRSWIIEEILASLSKLPDIKLKGSQFRLRDGRSVHIVSALLLQLIQTSAHDVRIRAQKAASERRHKLVLNRQDSGLLDTISSDETSLKEAESEASEIQMYNTGLDSATKAARTIVMFLTKRSSKGKSAKTSSDSEYRTIFDNLISDLLTVLHWPEWPAAGFTLNIITRFMITSVDDSKSHAETNALKALALDHLGLIFAKLRSACLTSMKEEEVSVFLPWEEIIAGGHESELQKLISARREISSHLSKRAGEDQAYDSARELTAATWGQRLAITLKDLDFAPSNPTNGDGIAKASSLLPIIKEVLHEVWSDRPVDVFDVGSAKEVARIDRLAVQIGASQMQGGLMDAILNVVLVASDSTVVALRTKALRALGQIVTSDPDILRNSKVRHAIEGHLLDNSPAVRDATVELVGKYIVQSPELEAEYYNQVADRIADTGLGVRKRVVRLLKTLYDLSRDMSRRTDISTRLALRMLDEDDTVKDIAVKTIEELWFNEPKDDAARWKVAGPAGPTDYDIKSAFSAKISVIMSTIANLRDRQIIEDLLQAIMADKPGKDLSGIRKRYSDINDAFIDSLIDSSEIPEHNVGNCIKAIYAFTSANPSIISSHKASMLLPYLKSAATPEDLLICDYLLKILQVCIPRMPKTATKFAHDLLQALQPMILKPSFSGGISVLQESIACMCTVVHNLTHEYKALVGLLKSCNNRLRESMRKSDEDLSGAANLRSLFVIISIIALLTEHCDFDKLRDDRPEYAMELDTISKGSITQHVYTVLLGLYTKFPDVKNKLLPCLGVLFKAYPSLMTLNSSAEVMDGIFSSRDIEGRAQLLRIMNNFLLAEMAKHTAAEKALQVQKNGIQNVNMEELVGNTHGFADSGVSSAIVQRYLHHILEAATSPHAPEQSPAFDLLAAIVKQGFAHPLQSMPVIVSLETSANSRISARANALHAILHTKHASLVNARFLECARASFDYQQRISNEALVQGHHSSPETRALLHPWYTLVREKRSSRQDFLKAIVKAFDVDTATLSASQDDIDFTRYMAENAATLDYKTVEEVLTVIRHLTSVLSVAGIHLMDTWMPSSMTSLYDKTDSLPVTMPDSSPFTSFSSGQPNPPVDLSQLPLARTSIVLSILMVLKSHLKFLFGLSEEKCAKWVAGKKSAVGDKPATKRHSDPISWTRIPHIITPLTTVNDVSSQKEQFLILWREDGVSGEPLSDVE